MGAECPIFATMQKETLTLKTVGASGAEAGFLVDGAACELHAYEYTAARMGSHTITATVRCRECLDRRWTGREFVMYGGQRYVLDGTPSSSKDSSDHRYSHSLSFILELDRVLSGTLFLDAVSDGAAVQDRPRSNTTSFSFYGTVREFSARLNGAMAYSGLGVTSRVDDEVPEGESLLGSFDDRTVLEAVQDAFSVYGVPYWYDLSGETPCIVFGFVHNAITTPLKYGADSPLLKIGRNNAGEKSINRCSGYGSDENLPYYYPNLSPDGELAAATNREGLTVRITDPAKAARLLGKTLAYSKGADPLASKKGWFSVSAYNKTSGTDQTSLNNEVSVGQTVAARENRKDGDDVFVYLPAGYYTNARFEIGVDFFVTAPCRVKFNVFLSTQRGMTGSRWNLCPGDGGSELASGYSQKPEVKIAGAGAYRFAVRNDIRSGSDIYLSGHDGIYGELSYMGVPEDALPLYWKNGTDIVNLSSCGLEITSGTPQEGDTITVRNAVTDDGARKFPVCGKLMPYIYRETLAKGRFYDAVNSKAAFVGRYSGIYPDTGVLEAAYGRIYAEGDGHRSFANPLEGSTPAVEHIVSFDDIRPTITGMTNAAGSSMDAVAAVDFDTDDDDSFLETDESRYAHPNFFMRLPRLDGPDGFNLFGHALEGTDMEIRMTSGACAGCTFPIKVAKDGVTNLVMVKDDGSLERDADGNVAFGTQGQDAQNDTRSGQVWLCLEKDSSTYGELMPCRGRYEPAAGDTFVITGISLPEQYVYAAEKRLEAAVVKYMAENNAEKFTYSVGFSRVFTAADEAVMPLLDENATVMVEYDGRQSVMYVSQYTVRATEDSAIPEVSITVSEKVSDVTDPIRQAVSQAKSDMEASLAGIDVTRLGLPYFLRKDVDDTAKGRPSFLNGLRVGNYTPGLLGAGGAVSVDAYGNSTAEVDFLSVRKRATFNEIEVQKTSGVGGQLIVSCASAEIISVTETEDAYRCFFRGTDGSGNAVLNLFAEGDLARAQSFDSFSPTFWWRKVVSIGADYIDLSKTDCADGSGIPRAGETAVQLGNVSDASRRGAQVLSCHGENAPAFRIYDGISGYSLEGCLRSGFETVDGKACFFVYGKGYIGDSGRTQYIESEDGNLTVTGIINALGGVMSGLLAVKDPDGNIRAGFSGGDAGKDDTHGRMVMFAGADSSGETQDEKIAGSKTKVYEDGHLVTASAEIEGKLTSSDGEIGGFRIGSDTLENRSEVLDYNPSTGKEEAVAWWGLRMTTAIIELYAKAYSGWSTNLRMQSYPAPSSGSFIQTSLSSSVTGTKATAAGQKRIGIGLSSDATGADVNYAFHSEAGMFAGLRPKALLVTGSGQIGAEENDIAGSNTLRDIDHTVIVDSASVLRLYLPKTPEYGQHYEVAQVRDGLAVYINGNGNLILASGNGGVLQAAEHYLQGRSRFTLDWLGNQWYMIYTVF